MNNFVILFILISDSTYAAITTHPGRQLTQRIPEFENIKYNKTAKQSWIGLLRVKIGITESVTGIVLISDCVALGNANEISKVDKKTIRKLAKATFYVTDATKSFNVNNYLLHPEYETDTLNTIALVYLERDKKWNPIQWPKFHSNWTHYYYIGFTDQNNSLEHIMHRMVPVETYTCREFYEKEELDFIYLWPSYFICSKGSDIKIKCTFEAGMALVANYKGTYVLVGLSISGPGCCLPSRYIDFFSYIPWIESQIKILKLKFTRRSGEMENRKTKPIDPRSNIVQDYYYNEDDFYVTRFNDTAMVLISENATKKDYHGDCLNNRGVMMYRESGLIIAKGNNTGVYALSLYDLFYNRITCVEVKLICSKRSLSKFWYEKGFHRDDFSDIIKVIPEPKRGPVPPKILFLTDTYHKYDKFYTANIYFKFEFRNEASIDIDFYGILRQLIPVTTEASDYYD